MHALHIPFTAGKHFPQKRFIQNNLVTAGLGLHATSVLDDALDGFDVNAQQPGNLFLMLSQPMQRYDRLSLLLRYHKTPVTYGENHPSPLKPSGRPRTRKRKSHCSPVGYPSDHNSTLLNTHKQRPVAIKHAIPVRLNYHTASPAWHHPLSIAAASNPVALFQSGTSSQRPL